MIFKDFCVSYGETAIFDNFNCEFLDKGINCIMGPSGAGKTTLLNCLAGLTEYKGEISQHSGVSYVFQESRLIPELTVCKNLEFALRGVYPNKVTLKQKIDDLLTSVGLLGQGGKYPHSLSGGMAQRVALIRAFGYPSEILLMDEPFGGLDVRTKDGVIEVFLKLWKDDKRTVFFVTHDLEEAKQLAGRIYVLSDKPIKEAVTTKQLS